MGIRHVIADARTDLEEGLEAILIAELADNDCWSTLISIATNLGEEDLASECERCFDEEEKHLNFVRGWLRAALGAPPLSALTPMGPTHPDPHERAAYLRGDGDGRSSSSSSSSSSRRGGSGSDEHSGHAKRNVVKRSAAKPRSHKR